MFLGGDQQENEQPEEEEKCFQIHRMVISEPEDDDAIKPMPSFNICALNMLEEHPITFQRSESQEEISKQSEEISIKKIEPKRPVQYKRSFFLEPDVQHLMETSIQRNLPRERQSEQMSNLVVPSSKYDVKSATSKIINLDFKILDLAAISNLKRNSVSEKYIQPKGLVKSPQRRGSRSEYQLVMNVEKPNLKKPHVFTPSSKMIIIREENKQYKLSQKIIKPVTTGKGNLKNLVKKTKMLNRNIFTPDSPKYQTKKFDMSEILKDDYSIEDSRLSDFYYRKVMLVDYSCMFFAMMGLMLQFVYQDADYYNIEDQAVVNALLILIQMTTILTIIVTFIRYLINIEYGKRQMLYSPFDNIISTNQYRSLLVEVLVLLIQPYPNINDVYFQTNELYNQTTFAFKTNWLLGIIMCTRLYIPIRVLLQNSNYMNPRASRLCRVYGCQASYMFVIKCAFKDYSILLCLTNIFMSLLLFGLMFRIFERPIQDAIDNIETALWLSLVTLTTVGYGDYKPVTSYGRLVSIILIIWGSFSTSLMVVVIKNILTMDPLQQRVITVYNKLTTREQMINRAAHLISLMIVQKRIKNNRKINEKFKKVRKQFQTKQREYKNTANKDDLMTELQRQFEFITKEISEISKQHKTIKQKITTCINDELPTKVRDIYTNKYKQLFMEQLEI